MWTLNALGALMLVVGLGAGCLVDQGLYEQRKADLTEAGADGGSDLTVTASVMMTVMTRTRLSTQVLSRFLR